jgi:hypothetical protein
VKYRLSNLIGIERVMSNDENLRGVCRFFSFSPSFKSVPKYPQRFGSIRKAKSLAGGFQL